MRVKEADDAISTARAAVSMKPNRSCFVRLPNGQHLEARTDRRSRVSFRLGAKRIPVTVLARTLYALGESQPPVQGSQP